MRGAFVFAALFAALPAAANEGVELSNKVRTLAATSQAKSSEAPFRTARDPMPELLMREEQERRLPQGACEHNATALCYDLADRRVVYRPARKYMPQFEGLRAESVSLRHDKLLLKYSFR
ncbi:MAG TPA: hypothetical protein VM073_03635 [Usitatibacter sp.]|nr:hypothetical protein [Usitatibacter sp.]